MKSDFKLFKIVFTQLSFLVILLLSKSALAIPPNDAPMPVFENACAEGVKKNFNTAYGDYSQKKSNCEKATEAKSHDLTLQHILKVDYDHLDETGRFWIKKEDEDIQIEREKYDKLCGTEIDGVSFSTLERKKVMAEKAVCDCYSGKWPEGLSETVDCNEFKNEVKIPVRNNASY